jgi:hypothetical protein
MPLAALLCPLGLKCTPPSRVRATPLYLTALGLIYAPWDSYMSLGGS